MPRLIRPILLATVGLLLSAPAHAQCDPAAELSAIMGPYQSRVNELTSNPTEQNLAQVSDLANQLNGAGQKLANGDKAGACADYAALKARLGVR